MTEASKLLPIGSVVKLKDAEKEIMITGFYTVSESDTSKIYDYSACLYPEGIVSSDKNLLFNHDQIEKVLYFGFNGEQEKTFKQNLADALNKLETKNQQN